MKKIFILLIALISLNSFSQKKSNETIQKPITLQEFVENIKAQNESIKNVVNLNVMVDDILIENLLDFKIDPKNVANIEILVMEPKDAYQHRSKPSIIIKTKKK